MKKLLIMAALLAGPCLGQTAPAYFHLDFTVKELEAGKVVSTRVYTTSVERGGNCMIRSGDKLPMRSGETTTFLDVGVNIDCNSVTVKDDQIVMHMIVDISSSTDNTPRAPIIHQTKWSAPVVIHLGKASTIFSSDSPTGRRQTQLEVTITPLT